MYIIIKQENIMRNILLLLALTVPLVAQEKAEEDKKELEKNGITGNFGPGTSMDTIIEHIKKVTKK